VRLPKVVRFHRTGDADVLQIEEIPMPDAAAAEVVINVEAFGLNRAEIMFRSGEYPQYAPELPSTIGYEAAGTVAAVGADVDSVHIGDRVSSVPSFKMGRYWSYGEVARVPELAVARYPERLSAIEAAAIWMPYMTAFGAVIEYGAMRPGDVAIVTAASSSVGIAILQTIKALGGIAIAVTTSESKRDFVQAQQPAHIVVSSTENLAERVMEITPGKGAQYAFDPVSGPGVAALTESIA
jgi:NADPH:quinone reductase-like Zn-dependent oxidoreductase